jgi:hypothetical protein
VVAVLDSMGFHSFIDARSMPLLASDECSTVTAALANFSAKLRIYRVGQNYIYTVHIRLFWQRNHLIYSVYIKFWLSLQ